MEEDIAIIVHIIYIFFLFSPLMLAGVLGWTAGARF